MLAEVHKNNQSPDTKTQFFHQEGMSRSFNGLFEFAPLEVGTFVTLEY